MAIKEMPKEDGIENGLKILREGYHYLPDRRKIYQSDVFKTRLLGQKAICMGGEEAARLFYDERKIKRSGAAPKFAQMVLLGPDGVQTLDGAEHRNRKKYFLNLMTEKRIEEWGLILKKELLKSAVEWMEKPTIEFYEESKKVLTKAVCEWAGVPLPEKDVEKRTAQLADLYETVAQTNPKFAKGVLSRKASTSWAKDLIQQVRDGEIQPQKDTALYQMAFHRNLDGSLIHLDPAATDLLSVLRPSVAISIYMSFIALTLHQFPEIRERLKNEDVNSKYYDNFTQEVRRYYPFFPFNAGITREDFIWKDYLFEKDTLVVFDYFGTGYDERLWSQPETFDPERFNAWEVSPSDQVQYKLVAQGGGDYLAGHRCPGEWNTVKAMKVTAEFLAKAIDYDVPPQDVSYSLTAMPTWPKSGMLFKNIR